MVVEIHFTGLKRTFQTTSNNYSQIIDLIQNETVIYFLLNKRQFIYLLTY